MLNRMTKRTEKKQPKSALNNEIIYCFLSANMRFEFIENQLKIT